MKLSFFILSIILLNVAPLLAQQDTLPNVFTPNKDGLNDQFILKSNSINSATVDVFNRYGTIVYQNYIAPKTDSINTIFLWNGLTKSGGKCPEGTYYYVVSFDKNEGEPSGVLKGYVTLLR